jgi:alcohol dehydrogenase (quinone), cytochrome c subunit
MMALRKVVVQGAAMVLGGALFLSHALAQDPPASPPAAAASDAPVTTNTPGVDVPAPVDVPPAPADPLVQRGEYLARIGNCVSCHTVQGGEPFAGGLPFKTPYMFLGTMYSTNITPDEETGIGKWTEADFVQAMHTGEGRNGSLYPAFPYTSFTKVSDEDVKAIYAYLRTVKPVKAEPPSNSFIFAFRFGMKIWNALFFEEGRYVADSSQSEEWNRGAYLVNGLGHCSACHTPRNALLAEKPTEHLWGAVVPDVVMEGQYRPWFAVNLTQTKNGGLGAWSAEDIRRYLKTGHNRFGGTFGPMNEVIANSLSHMTDADAKAMAAYIKSLPAAPDSPAMQISDEEKKAGEELYLKHCEECHAKSGRGGFMKAPPVAGSAIAQGRDPASLINIILFGAEPAKGLSPPGAWEAMRAFRERMNDAEVAAVANYVRSSWNNTGSKITAQDVAKHR